LFARAREARQLFAAYQPQQLRIAVRNADRIYVLDQGRVVEQGTHVELQSAGGQYSRFFELQAIGLVPDASNQ
jgi:ABC-type transport system involved in cytochrome bd biosynthesis fused ATPase/permease subunit